MTSSDEFCGIGVDSHDWLVVLWLVGCGWVVVRWALVLVSVVWRVVSRQFGLFCGILFEWLCWSRKPLK